MKECYKAARVDTSSHCVPRQDRVSCIKSVSKQGRTPCSGPSGLDMTCGRCGHVADFEEFTRRPVSGELPMGRTQCPKCGLAVERKQGRGRVLPSGFVMPGDVRLVEVGGVL